MSITNGYVTLPEYKLWASVDSTDTNDDAVIEDIIEGASRDFDLESGRTFYARTETRYYDIPEDGSRTLKVDDDLLTITTLTNGDGTVITATHYDLVPKNVTPYYGIRLKASSSYYWTFDSDGNSQDVISVAGTWGFAAAAPDNVKQAVMGISKMEYASRTGENTQGVARVTAAGVVISPSSWPAKALKTAIYYKRRT